MVLITLAVGLGVVLALLVLVGGGNFALELAEGDSKREAWTDTRTLLAGIAGGVGGLVVSGIVDLAQLLDIGLELIGVSPIAFTNMMSIGLGWLGISGRLDIGANIYLGLSVGFLALALLVSEVKDE